MPPGGAPLDDDCPGEDPVPPLGVAEPDPPACVAPVGAADDDAPDEAAAPDDGAWDAGGAATVAAHAGDDGLLWMLPRTDSRLKQ
jgi:hypothetical protein